MIVGIDPGTTTGIAVFGLNGKLLGIRSGRNFGKKDVVKWLIGFGRPVLVTSDVSPVPEFVREIATSFNTALFEQSLSVDEKNVLCRSAGVKLANNHEKDAFCSGLQAYRSVKNEIAKIDRRLEKDRSRIIRDVMKGIRLSQALPATRPQTVKKPKRSRTPTIVEKKIDGGPIIHRLENELRKKEMEIQSLLVKRPESSREVRKKEEVVSRLHRELELLQKKHADLEEEHRILLRLLGEVSSGSLAFVSKEAYTDSPGNRDWSSFNTVYTSSARVKAELEARGVFVRLVQEPIFFNDLVFFSLGKKDTKWLKSLVSAYRKR